MGSGKSIRNTEDPIVFLLGVGVANLEIQLSYVTSSHSITSQILKWRLFVATNTLPSLIPNDKDGV